MEPPTVTSPSVIIVPLWGSNGVPFTYIFDVRTTPKVITGGPKSF